MVGRPFSLATVLLGKLALHREKAVIERFCAAAHDRRLQTFAVLWMQARISTLRPSRSVSVALNLAGSNMKGGAPFHRLDLYRASGPRMEVFICRLALHRGREPFGRTSFSEKLVNGTTHRLLTPSHRRQCGDLFRRGNEYLPVHPRACGERPYTKLCANSIAGSSPRVRGTHTVAARASSMGRFIPARAGNATSGTRSAGTLPVHPRACGERNTQIHKNRFGNGSSPRVRGTLGRAAERLRGHRFIPARAGNA